MNLDISVINSGGGRVELLSKSCSKNLDCSTTERLPSSSDTTKVNFLRKYRALDTTGRDELQAFKSKQGYSEINDIWDYWATWKRNGSGTTQAQLQEKAFKQAHGIPEQIRKQDPAPGQSFASPVEDFIELLTTVSQTFGEENYGQNITLFRGVSYRASHLLSKIESDPMISNYSIKNPSVLINHTIRPESAANFAEYNLVWELELSYSDLMLAPDSLRKVYDRRKGQQILMADGEFQVRGDRVSSVPGDQLYLYTNDGQSRVQLHKVAQKPGQLTLSEHRAVESFVAELDSYLADKGSNYPPSGPAITDDLKSAMESWFSVYQSMNTLRALNIRPAFNRLFR